MANIKYYAGIDLQQNELQNAVIHNAASAPSPAVEGQIYQNTTDNKLYVNDGTNWIDMSTHTISNVTVNDTKATLAAFILDGYDTANFAEGDVLVLSTATDPAERTWMNLGTDVGDETDFVALSMAYDEAEIKALFTAGTGLEFSNGQFSISDSGVGTTQLANDSVDKDKINADVAGIGLAQNADGSLEVNADNSTVEIDTDTLQVKDGGITEAKLDSTVAAKINGTYKETFGDGVTVVNTITHNLGTKDVMTQIFDVTSGACVDCDVVRATNDTLEVTANPAFTLDEVRILVRRID